MADSYTTYWLLTQRLKNLQLGVDKVHTMRQIRRILFPSVFRVYGLPAIALLFAGLFFPATLSGEPVVGIISGSFPDTPSAGDPLSLSPFLKENGISSVIVDAFELLKPEGISPEDFDILLFPNGAYFPLEARENFVQYLQSGGCFISLGGYAFDHLCEREGGRWVEKLVTDPEEWLSGRKGSPGDTMGLRPEQISVFDPTYKFQRVRKIVTAPGQQMLKKQFDVETFVRGFAATAMSGSNNPVFPRNYARWISLLEARDRYGRPSGSVLAAMFHHDGPYKGSAWAFSGVTSADLFSRPASPLRGSLVETIRNLRRRVFLVASDTHQVSYLAQEGVALTVRLANYGPESFSGRMFVMAGDTSVGEADVAVAPETEHVASFSVESTAFAESNGLYRVEIREGDNVVDAIHGGVVLLGEATSGPLSQIDVRDNVFTIRNRPTFLFGTNQTGMVWFTPLENPYVWRHDLWWMRDHGLRMLRLLHFSPYAAQGFEGKGAHEPQDLAATPPERLQKETDALVRLCREEGAILFLTLHDWLEEELSRSDLQAQRKWNRFWADRYKDDPHVIFDIQNEPHIGFSDNPDIVRLWNNYLRETYRTDEALRAAWTVSPPEASIGSIPFVECPNEWDSVRQLDVNIFRVQLLERWLEENVEGVKDGNPKALVTVGFLPDFQSAEKLLATENLDYANTHYYGPLHDFPLHLKMLDRCFEGKSLTLGEFGAQEAHHARVNGEEGLFIEPSVDRYLAVVHESIGLGAGFVLNWCLKDMPDAIFPWGLTYAQDGVDKAWAKTYRNTALFFSTFVPSHETPEVFLLVPDAHRLGGRSWEITRGIFTSIEWLLSEHVDFGVINERDLNQLPEGVKLLIWPIPYCPSDETCVAVHAFAYGGGHVYFSGDIAYDRNRKRTRTSRFQALGFTPPPEFPPLQYPESADIPAAASVQIGSGTMTFLPWPAELYPDRIQGESPYAHLIEASEVNPIEITPDDPALHAYRVPERTGESYLFFRMDPDRTPIEYRTVINATDTVFSVGGYRGALFSFNRRGELMAYEGQGRMSIGGEDRIRSTGSVMLRALGSQPLADSNYLAVFPIDEGTVEIENKTLENPLCLVGEFVDTEWRTYETFEPVKKNDGFISVEIDNDRATCILILCEKERESAAARWIERRLRL